MKYTTLTTALLATFLFTKASDWSSATALRDAKTDRLLEAITRLGFHSTHNSEGEQNRINELRQIITASFDDIKNDEICSQHDACR